jgi:hypothetical protein
MLRPATFHLGPTAVAIALLAAGCSNRPPEGRPVDTEASGAVQLSLTLSGGVRIERVSYRITAASVGLTPLEGVLNIGADGTAVAPVFGGLPAAGDYTIELNAVSVDGGTSCQGAAAFIVQPHVTTPVRVAFQCRRGGQGSVRLDFGFNNCPVLTSYFASSTSVGADGTIQVSAAASDPDPGTPLMYSWSAPDGGSFANPAAASTTFTCNGPGARRLVITVSDGRCGSSAEISVRCGSGSPSACDACAQANCSAEGPGCGSLPDPHRRMLCEGLLACMRRTDCNRGGANNSTCWCGTVDLNTCTGTAGAANGACVQEELAAAESTDPGTIVQRFADPTYASGAAHNHALCLFELCSEVCR